MVVPGPNVECTRCGHQWWADEYDRRDIVPRRCPVCYQDAVRPIPAPPSRMEVVMAGLRQRLAAVPQRLAAIRHRMVLWEQKNRFRIEVSILMVSLAIIFAVLYQFLFVWS